MKTTESPIVVEQRFNASPSKVWKAITEIHQMRQWFFENIEAFEPKVGFTTKFVVENEGRIFRHLWGITEVTPKKKICYNWKYEGYTGDSIVTFTLSTNNNYTQLRLTHQVTADFPQDIPEFKRESCLDGWNYFIKKRLNEYLASK